MSISTDGKYLSSGSGKGGVFTWDLDGKPDKYGDVEATPLRISGKDVYWPEGKDREVGCVDWGKDLVCFSFTVLGRIELTSTSWLLALKTS